MNYSEAKSAAPATRRQRVEEPSDLQKSLVERLQLKWPQYVTNTGSEEAPERISSRLLRSVFIEHDRPHATREESWHINGRLGRLQRFAVSATFSSTVVVSGTQTSNEEVSKSTLYALQWSVLDTQSKKHYRFSEIGPGGATLLTALLAYNELGPIDPHVSQAVVEQLDGDVLILPDQAMTQKVSVKPNELDMSINRSYMKVKTIKENAEGSDSVPCYHIHLESCSNETADGNKADEVKAIVDLVLQPRTVPVLGGERGVDKSFGWMNESFSYGFPHMRMKEGSIRLTRASDDLEIARELEMKEGAMWMEHSFGGVLPLTPEEGFFVREERRLSCETDNSLLDRCYLRMFNAEQDCISVTRVAGTAESCRAVVQCGTKREGFAWTEGVSFKAEPSKQYRSTQSGLLYSTEWVVKTPTHDGASMDLTLRAVCEDQEMVSILNSPGYWEGAVSVEGVITLADQTTKKVTGTGYVHSARRIVQQKSSQLFDLLRNVSTRSMEKPEVAALPGWESIAEGPAMKALSAASVVASMQGLRFSDAECVVLGAMLGVYGYMFHHGSEQEEVKKALRWVNLKWTSFFASTPISYKTLLVRAFMLREIASVAHAKCSAWIPRGSDALDIVALGPITDGEEADAQDGKEFPSAVMLQMVPTPLEVTQLKALLDGTWKFVSSTGNLSGVFVEQGIGILKRNLMSRVNPVLRIVLDAAAPAVSIRSTTMLLDVERTIPLQSNSFKWKCPIRGQLECTSCVLSGGQQLYIETAVQQGVERVWYSFEDEGKKLVETIQFYRSRFTAQPSASCVRYYTIQA